MHSPLISVVMPVYNAARTVERAIASVLTQSEPRFEFIVVDDGSTDATRSVVDSLAVVDERLRLVPMPHGGIVTALNRGLALAQGRYIARMDADDIALPLRLERQLALLDEHLGLGVASCLVEHQPESGSGNGSESGRETGSKNAGEPPGTPPADARGNAGYALHVDWVNNQVSAEQISLGRFVEAPVAHPTVMFRRELVERLGGYRDGPFPEDYELWLRWMAGGVRFQKVPEVLHVWSDAPDRLSRTDPRYDVEAFHRVKAAYLADWLAAHNPHYPEIVVWGGGKVSRRRAAHLEPYGCRIAAYLDVDPKKIGHVRRGRPVLPAVDVGPPGAAFVVAYVAKRGAHEFIRSVLEPLGYVEGEHFVFAA